MYTYLELYRKNDNLEVKGQICEPSDIPDNCLLIIIRDFLHWQYNGEPKLFEIIKDKYNTYACYGIIDIFCINKKYNFTIYDKYNKINFMVRTGPDFFWKFSQYEHPDKQMLMLTADEMKDYIHNNGPCIIRYVLLYGLLCDDATINTLFNLVQLTPYIQGSRSNNNGEEFYIMTVKGATVKAATVKTTLK